MKTIHHNEETADEFAVGGFTPEPAKTIHAPLIAEAFLQMECTLKRCEDLSGAGITSMVIGEVGRICVDERYARSHEKRYGEEGFMLLVPGMQDLVSGEPYPSAIGVMDIRKYD